jgi:anti-anti-sigma factor
VTGAWEWSGAVYQIHGFTPGEVVPGAEPLLAHAHAADRHNIEWTLQACLRDGKLFSSLYRLIDASGRQHWVLITGEGSCGADGTVTGIRGYLIDLTLPLTRARTTEVARVLGKTTDSRATIEQAKGALMLLHGLDARTAFALLSWHSQRTNIKLRDLARRLVSGLAGEPDAIAGVRARLDENVYGPGRTSALGPRGALVNGAAGVLTTQMEAADGLVVLRLSGDVNMATGPQLDTCLAEAVAAAVPPAPVVIDLSRVTHFGSVGLALLTCYHKRCLAMGSALHAVTGDGPAQQILATAAPRVQIHAQQPAAGRLWERP